MIVTVSISWNEFCTAHAELLPELLPALRSLGEDDIALRNERWGILPVWEKSAFFFESYDDELVLYREHDEATRL